MKKLSENEYKLRVLPELLPHPTASPFDKLRAAGARWGTPAPPPAYSAVTWHDVMPIYSNWKLWRGGITELAVVCLVLAGNTNMIYIWEKDLVKGLLSLG